MKVEKIKLPKCVDFVYCFKKEKVIMEKECDNYEYNLECDKENDILNRTHRRGSYAGYNYAYISGNVLNSCNYCIKHNELYEEFILPQEVTKRKKKRFFKLF